MVKVFSESLQITCGKPFEPDAARQIASMARLPFHVISSSWSGVPGRITGPSRYQRMWTIAAMPSRLEGVRSMIAASAASARFSAAMLSGHSQSSLPGILDRRSQSFLALSHSR